MLSGPREYARMPQQFASDNNAGICPQALDALIRANAEGHVTGYGDDPWTREGLRAGSASCSRRTARCSSSSTARRPMPWRWRRSAGRTMR